MSNMTSVEDLLTLQVRRCKAAAANAGSIVCLSILELSALCDGRVSALPAPKLTPSLATRARRVLSRQERYVRLPTQKCIFRRFFSYRGL